MKLMVSVTDESGSVVWAYGTFPDGNQGGISSRLYRENGVGEEIVRALMAASRCAEGEFGSESNPINANPPHPSTSPKELSPKAD